MPDRLDAASGRVLGAGHRHHGRPAPVVHQSGPRWLWDDLDSIRHAWLRDGSLPAYGAKVTISPDGSVHLTRGRGQATIATGS